jgi:hypothetical protein
MMINDEDFYEEEALLISLNDSFIMFFFLRRGFYCS